MQKSQILADQAIAKAEAGEVIVLCTPTYTSLFRLWNLVKEVLEQRGVAVKKTRILSWIETTKGKIVFDCYRDHPVLRESYLTLRFVDLL